MENHVNRLIALVRFPDGTIMMDCFNKSTMCAGYALITPDDLLASFNGNIITWDDYITHGRGQADVAERIKNAPSSEFFDVEIYCDLNGGVWWNGTASKGFKILSSGVRLDYIYVRNTGRPDWVREFEAGYLEKKKSNNVSTDIVSDYDLTKRERIEIAVYNIINDLDPSGDNAANYRERFAAMSDSEFEQFVQSLVNPPWLQQSSKKGDPDD